MRIAAGADHAGYTLKSLLIEHLQSAGHTVTDLGTHSEESVDYPDFAALVAHNVVAQECDFGLCCCGTGIGISIAANKIRGVRAAVVHDVSSAHLAHNDANIVCFGARLIGHVVALDSIDEFLRTPFDGGRHTRRIDKITRLEEDK